GHITTKSRVSRISFGALVARRGERADLVVRAVAAGAPGRRGVEAARADAGRRRLHRVDRAVEVLRRRHVATDDVRVDEAQLEALGQGPGHLLPGQPRHLQLQARGHPAVGVLLAVDLGGLVVDDHRAQEVFVDAIVASAHAVGTEREAEFLLDPRRLGAFRLFVMPEAPEGLAARPLAPLLVLAREEAFGRLVAARAVVDHVLAGPRALVDGQEIVE